MCVVSMVFDEYGKRDWDSPYFPSPYEIDRTAPPLKPLIPAPPTSPQDLGKLITLGSEIERLSKLIEEFKEALAAAKVVDRLTNKPDCEDPEKRKLEDRVAELERRLAEVEQKPKPRKKSAKKRKAKAKR